jgi:TonB family protein
MWALVARLFLASSTICQLTPVQIQAPEYPEAAVKARMTGTVVVALTVDPEGLVTSADAGGKPNPLLAKVCEVAALEWRFEADSSQVERATVVKFEFTIRSDEPANRKCFVGPTRVSVVLPDTVRILGWYLPSLPTVLYQKR